uniref:Uncharacterized protein n=1 Tax=Aegilops tauschii subsp. strangulata TaxID=200361 RepID=A0A453Q1C9_AEGTS
MRILPYLYDREVIRELAIVRWAEEKGNANGSNKVFVKQSVAFIQARPTLCCNLSKKSRVEVKCIVLQFGWCPEE